MVDPTEKSPQFASSPDKRQRTFQVLYELAVAMTGDRSLSENLQLVVDRSRELLGAETAYVALCDEESNTVFMHTVSGIRTRAFKEIRLPFGKGLGGLVAKTRRGFIIEDYLTDENITSAVDDIVAAEGIVSGMAAPIQMGERILGVLYVFNRRSTEFSASDLDTVFLIGNLAAVEVSRKQVEERLRRSREKYRSVMEASGEPIVVYDREGNAAYLNPAFTRVFGWSPDELLGKKIPYVPPEDQSETAERINEVLTSPDGYSSYESRRLTKAGDVLDVIVSASAYYDRARTPQGMIVNLRDITARKKAELSLKQAHDELEQRVAERTAELQQSNERLRKEIKERKQVELALRESERRYRTLLDFVPYPIVVFNLDGRISYLNPTFTEVFGWTLDELKGFLIPYVPPGLEEETEDNLSRLFAEKIPVNCETRRLTKDGRIRDVSMRTALYTESGSEPAGEIVILRDVTEEKRIARTNEAMLRISMALPAHPDLEGLLDYVTGEVKELLNAEGAVVLLLDECRQELYFAGAAYDNARTKKRAKETRFRLDEAVAGEVIACGEPIVIHDALQAQLSYPDRDQRLGYQTRSLLEVPLRSGERIIGVLGAINKKEGTFDQRDVDLLTTTEGTVALSIENARAAANLKKAYREVKSLSRAKDKAFHHLSHELKTPTSVLLTSLEILAKRLASVPEKSWKPTFERANRNLNRILEIQYEAEDIILDKQHKTYYLLSLLLDQCADELEALIAEEIGEGAVVERIRMRVNELFGPKELAAETVDLAQFVRQRLEHLEPAFSHRQVEIATHLGPSPSVVIPLDPLQKIVDGLVRNAVENTPDGGKIEVMVSGQGEGTQFAIRDSGVGIDQEAKGRLFEGFFPTQDTWAYSSKRPFDFQAGGKGADLLRIKIFSERYNFKIDMESIRCPHLLTETNQCPGAINACPYCTRREECNQSSGTAFLIYFPNPSEIHH